MLLSRSIAIALSIFLPFLLCSQNELIVRISAEKHLAKENVINAWVEIYSLANHPVNLADQNYRLYYDSDLVTLKKKDCKATLPKDQYSPLQLVDHIEGAQPDISDSLLIKGKIGFINFKIDLLDSQHGGKRIMPSEGWTRIALLTFDVKNRDQAINLIWAQPEQTSQIATAFVEISQWINPAKVQPMHIHSYVNERILPDFIEEPLGIQIRPNPMVDYTSVRFDRSINDPLDIRIIDLNGNLHHIKRVKKGEKLCELFCADMPSGLYFIELIDANDGSRVYSDLIAKVK